MPRPAATLQQRLRLVPFEPSLPQGLQVNASLSWLISGPLTLSFEVLNQNALTELVLPLQVIDGEQRNGVRRDGLWTTTCFEAFLGLPGESRYWEINLAANGDWAVYRFNDCRSGQEDQTQTAPPLVHLRRWQHQLGLEASLDLSPWWPQDTCPDIALTTVLDRGDKGLSHWAISHPSDRADFHQRSAFLKS